MSEVHQFVRADFRRFKAFDTFTLHLRHFNILVGPNNAGKSTILAAFRILEAAMRRANSRKAELVTGPQGRTFGYPIDLSDISIAEENIFYNYDASQAATVRFTLSNKNSLLLYFPEHGECRLILEANGTPVRTPSASRFHFNCPIGFVPILGPLTHKENLFGKEAARLALFSYEASRNFRNIWHHYPEKFDEFRSALARTWPGMDIERPEVDTSHERPRLHMFCQEERITREIVWSGFGFQVWCQLLTHLIQSRDKSLFLIDEPDIYLHSDLQRQLLNLLRHLGPDIIIATHSTEIITEAETDDILLINKRKKAARRLQHASQLIEVFSALGSTLNPVLTQLAKTRRVVFVEGMDFQILGKFARKLGFENVANRSDFAVVAVDGFSPDRVRSLKLGMETSLGSKILAAAIFDKDYRSDDECKSIAQKCELFCDYVAIYTRKEVENFLLVPTAIDCASERKVADQAKRTGHKITWASDAGKLIDEFAAQKKPYVAAQYLDSRKRFERSSSSTRHDATINEEAFRDFEECWKDADSRSAMIPGKDALSAINLHLQEKYGISLSPIGIIDAMTNADIPAEMIKLISDLSKFSVASIK
jgi:AAA domain, putative AbiEii toxin, Type IV TA system